MTRKKELFIIFNLFRVGIVYLIIKLQKNKYDIIFEEVDYWLGLYSIKIKSKIMRLGYLLCFFPEYRNLLYHRLRFLCNSRLYMVADFFFKQRSDLFLTCKNIGKNLFIQHGFSTIISAKSIGDFCWVNQQVTIGFSNKTDAPIIGNGVRICCGAKIIGKVNLGDNCVVGANAVVVRDVLENNVVVGAPAHVVHNNHEDKLFKK